MPTYEDLRDYFDSSETLRGLVERAAKIPIVRGFTLAVDPLWALCDDAEDGLIPAGEIEKDDPSFWPFGRWPRWPLTEIGRPAVFQGYRRRDLGRKLPMWDQFQKSIRKQLNREPSPVVMTIVYGPMRTPVVGDDRKDDRESLRALVVAVAESKAWARIEERPRARLAYASGDHVTTSQGKSGTYGGTLVDAAGKKYGMTCAHVAGLHDHVNDAMATHLGKCIAETPRVMLPAGTVCDPILLQQPRPYPSNGPSVNMLDFALIDLVGAPAPATLSGVAASLTQGQDVLVDGAQTQIKCKLGSLAISYAFVEGGQDYCFRDVVELVPQPYLPIGGTLGKLVTATPTQGDSGAWVLTQDPIPAWAAVFFGEDGNRGFCIRASWAHSWAMGAVGKPLFV